MKRTQTPLWLLPLLAALGYLAPTRVAEAKGHFFSGPIFSIILSVALTAAFAFIPPLAALASTVSSTIDGFVGIAGFTEVVAGAETLASLALASDCLAGDNNIRFSHCSGSNGGNNNNTAPSPAKQQAASITTHQSAVGPNYTCPSGYHIENKDQCISDGYVSCSSAGHPELVCPNNASCNADGTCSGQSGSSCDAKSGSACTSSANSCGMSNTGTYQCSGACPAIPPADTDCAPPQISISASPSLVNPGGSCTVSWQVTNATDCQLSSDSTADKGLPEKASLPSGSYASGPITAGPTYTLFCHNGKVVTASASVTCHINPQYGEQ